MKKYFYIVVMVFITNSYSFAQSNNWKIIPLPALKVTVPQKISLPITFTQTYHMNGIKEPQIPSEAYFFQIEPGLTAQKIHIGRLFTYGGAGPVAWNYKVSSLYTTREAFGINKNKFYLGAELGGWVYFLSGNIGAYVQISDSKNKPNFIISIGVGIGGIP